MINISHDIGKGMESVVKGYGKSTSSIFSGVGGIMKTLSNPLVIVGIGAVVLIVLMRR